MRAVLSAFIMGAVILPACAPAQTSEEFRARGEVVRRETQELNYEEFRARQRDFRQRILRAREEIATLQGDLATIKRRLEEVDGRLAAVMKNSSPRAHDKEEFRLVETELTGLRNALENYRSLSPENLWARRAEIRLCEEYFTTLKKKPVVCKLADTVRRVEDLIALLRKDLRPGRGLSPLAAQVPLAVRHARPTAESLPMTHCVVGKEGTPRTLSAIAATLYGDMSQWTRIYEANRELIDEGYRNYLRKNDDPKIHRPQDFVLPGWVLKLPH